MEKFVRASAEHLAFTTEFLHLDFKHHAGVVVEATSDRQVHRHGRGCRRQGCQRRKRAFEFIEGFQRNTVHAGEEFTSRPEGFHAAVERCERSKGFGIGRVKTVRFEEGSQSRIVAFVEQAHGAGDGRFTGGGVHLAGQSETRQGVLEHTDVANANLPALKAGGVEHVDRQGEHFGFSQRPRCPDEFHTVLEELAVAAGLHSSYR